MIKKPGISEWAQLINTLADNLTRIKLDRTLTDKVSGS